MGEPQGYNLKLELDILELMIKSKKKVLRVHFSAVQGGIMKKLGNPGVWQFNSKL